MKIQDTKTLIKLSMVMQQITLATKLLTKYETNNYIHV